MILVINIVKYHSYSKTNSSWLPPRIHTNRYHLIAWWSIWTHYIKLYSKPEKRTPAQKLSVWIPSRWMYDGRHNPSYRRLEFLNGQKQIRAWHLLWFVKDVRSSWPWIAAWETLETWITNLACILDSLVSNKSQTASGY